MSGLIIDLFAGGGGASEGIFRATGRHPDIAVNHDAEAIALHAANHPTTLHLQDDIRRVDVIEVLGRFGNRPVDLLWASPDCKDHSKAKGGKPKDKNIRGLAWEVLRWSAAIRRATGSLPRLINLENVEEFADWGPVHRYGRKAGTVMRRRRKETFRLWRSQLESLGYVVDFRELKAADYGAPTTRKRLFVKARSDGQPITWPAVTHGPRKGGLFDHHLLPYRSAASIIDWALPIPSIFGRKQALKPKTQARIAKGIKRYVIDAPHPFIVPVTHTQGGNSANPVTEPLRTITTAKGGEFAVGAPVLSSVAYGDDRPGAGLRAWSPEDPLRTLTASGGEAVASAFLKPRYGEREGQEPRALNITEPHPTVVPGGNGADLVAPILTTYYGGEGRRSDDRASTVDEPVRTVTTENRHALTAAFLGRQFGTTVSGRDLEDPHPAVMTDGGGGKSQVVTAYMAQGNAERVGRAVEDPLTTLTHRCTQQQLVAPMLDKYYATGVAADPTKPLDAVTARDRFGLAGAFIEQANTGMVGHDARSPVSTIMGKAANQRLIETCLAELDAPEGSRRRAVLEFLWEHFGEPSAEEWSDPTATAQSRLRFGLVLLDGVVWQIVDIGMRMLKPRELFNAQGFRPDYIIEITFNGKPLTKTAQTRMAGNSVCPDLAEAILRQDLTWLKLPERAEAA